MDSRKGMLLAALLLVTPGIRANEEPRERSNLTAQAVQTSPGIHTDRLSPRKLRAWKRIEAIVFAKDARGQFSHPKLHSLWQSVETSGHVIYIQPACPKDHRTNRAGEFKIEKLDPDGRQHVAVIELCLSEINDAQVKERAQPGHDFIQFEGLSKRERHAEVLAHELAHAVWFLSDQRHARLLDDLDKEADSYNRRRQALKGVAWDEQMQRQLNRLGSWEETIERPARTAEAEVWWELQQSRGKRRMAKVLRARRSPIARLSLLPASLAAAPPNARAEEQPRNASNHSGTTIETASGIRTDRLTKSQLKAWESIMQIVLAIDEDGRPVHPKLFALYQLAATSGRAIFLELSTQRPTMCALVTVYRFRLDVRLSGIPMDR